MSVTIWRLLLTGACDGPMNMAIDQAIMEAVGAGQAAPTLRFYAWQPPCLSLGYTQPVLDVDQERLKAQGWDLVRRPTGGRAILHTDELTYSVAVPVGDPVVAGDIVESYRRLSLALLEGLRRLGADAEADKQQMAAQATAKGPVCFEVPSHYEITVGGKKLIGSAQVRKFGAVLQHGSLPLVGDIARICDALVFADETARAVAKIRVAQRATTLESALGQSVSWQQAVAALRQAFQDTFGLEFWLEDRLSLQEQHRVEELYHRQYTTDEWNHRF